MLTQNEIDVMLNQLDSMLPKLRKHYRQIEDEQSAYSNFALFNIGKAIDGISDALIGLRGE